MDIDLDLPSNFDVNKVFNQAITASRVQNKQLVKHPTGAYFQKIPIDKQTNLAAIPYDKAEKLGYIKIDFLHLSLLKLFKNKNQMRKLLNKEPDWNILHWSSAVKQMFHIHNHFNVVQKVRPRCIEELADCLALIRPSKRYLLSQYALIRNRPKDHIRKLLYMKPHDNQYHFKRSHAIAYACTVVLQMHIFKQKLKGKPVTYFYCAMVELNE